MLRKSRALRFGSSYFLFNFLYFFRLQSRLAHSLLFDQVDIPRLLVMSQPELDFTVPTPLEDGDA